MTKVSRAESSSSEIAGGPVSRRAVDSRGASCADGQETVPPADRKSSLTLWLWVAAGFLLLAIGWTVLFSVAHSAKIQTVPLSTSGGGTR